MLNPLYPQDNDESAAKPDHESSRPVRRHGNSVKPLHKIEPQPNPAADLIRQKIQTLYDDEPKAADEIEEVTHDRRLSKHQKFMLELSTSGKPLAEIQTAWHNYYIGLPDSEKHEVWQEFYDNNGSSRFQQATEQQRAARQTPEQVKFEPAEPVRQAINPNNTVVVGDNLLMYEDMLPRDSGKGSPSAIKKRVLDHVTAGGTLKAKHHFQSLLFGLGIGMLVVVITLFSFFNNYIIAPFIQPSRDASATPLIIGADNVSPTATPEVIIPKINVEIPLNFSVTSTNENVIEGALEDGVVHYPTTVLPGQTGNTAFFGHSSNNIFNPGHYKFAFALLHDLVPGDTFYLTYGGKAYAYQVYQKAIVEPNDVNVLDNVPGKVATATLITCDPPGTSLHRLIVWGTQISPDPSTDTTGSNTSTSISPSTQLPSNGPSLWDRFIHGLTSWI
jgi:LPXTG-site transpeptidase (sortase) family protein